MLALARCLLATAPAAAADPAPFLGWLDRGDATLTRTDGYTVLYHKKEQVTPKLLTDDVMRVKFMKPFNVYMEWINPHGKGGEAIYVDGWNRNRVRTHPGGFWGMLTFNLVPDSHWIMRSNRHNIRSFGLAKLHGIVRENVQHAVAAGDFIWMDHGPAVMFGRATRVLEAALPVDPAKGYYCHRAVMHFDVENGLIIHIRNFNAADRLVEEYGYEDFTPDVRLSAADFDPANPAYRF